MVIFLSLPIIYIYLDPSNANTLKPRQNDLYFADGIFRLIALYKHHCIFIQSSLNSGLKYPVDIKISLVQIMAWNQLGNKPSSETIMI